MPKKQESEINRLFRKKTDYAIIRGDKLLEIQEKQEEKGTTPRPTLPVEKDTREAKKETKKSDRSSSSSTPTKACTIPPQWEIGNLRATSAQLVQCIAATREKTLAQYGISPSERNRYTRHESRIKKRVEALSLSIGRMKEQEFTKEVVRLMLQEPFTVRSIIDNFDYESTEKNNRDKERIRRIAKKLVEAKVLRTRTIGPGTDGIEINSFLRNTQLYWFNHHDKHSFESVLEYYRFKGKQFKRRVKRKKTKEGEPVKVSTCTYCHEPIEEEQDFRYYKEGKHHTSCLRKAGVYMGRVRREGEGSM